MTIEVGVQGPDGAKRVAGSILAGDVGSFADYGTEPRSILAVFCLADDSGGEVYRFKEDGSYEDSQVRVVTADSLVPKNRIAVLAPDQPFECDITSRSQKVTRVILTHVIDD